MLSKLTSIKGLAISGAFLALISLLNKVVGFLRDYIISNINGFNADYDTFIIMLATSGIVISGLKGSILNVYSSYYYSEVLKPQELVSSYICIFAIFIIFFSPYFIILSHYIYDIELNVIYDVSALYLMYVAFSLTSALIYSHIVATKKFIKAELSTTFPNIIPVIFLIGLSLFDFMKINVTTLTGLVVLGSFLEMIYLFYRIDKRDVFLVSWGDFKITKKKRSFMIDIFMLFLSSTVLSMMNLIDAYFAKSLGEGNASMLITSGKYISFINGFIMSSLGVMIIPHLSELFMKNKRDFKKKIIQICICIWLVSLLGILLIWNVVPYAVHIIYIGDAIKADDVVKLSQLIQYSLLMIPLFLTGMIFSRGIVAAGRSSVMLKINITSIIICFLSNSIAVDIFSMGLLGIVISTCIVYFWSNVCLSVVIFRMNIA
ncbi:hypothetical protein [Grimontia hollisae]|uniref:hypothetical protein n=1 Tax=Grimontia hollisae TaxID=673 RepID=UPI001303C943|nr:hypothetical protein [Grimontia hollisae]